MRIANLGQISTIQLIRKISKINPLTRKGQKTGH